MSTAYVTDAIAEITGAFSDSQYPEGFLERYVQLECLGWGHGVETFLVRRRGQDELYVAKCYDKELYSSVQETGILRSLQHEGIPAFADEFENQKMACIVREYVEGRPLDQVAAEGGLSKKDAIDVCLQLCDILDYLHSQPQPIIHRDVKPQNVIVRPDGKISLIDFDISRVYQTGAKADTQFLGTREFAPPEQYGFSQTDCRADIYSIGVLLGWLLTREMDPREVSAALGRDPLGKIYRKCAAFSPEDRYHSVAALKSALVSLDGGRQRAAVQRVAAVLSGIVLLAAGFLVGRYTDFLAAALNPSVGVAFQEPMIEEAVRLQLGKDPNSAILEDELLSVTELFIFGGSLVARTEEEFTAGMERLVEDKHLDKGPIRTLDDLQQMPNLTRISIAMQQVVDLAPLAGLANLEHVDIRNNPVTDLSSLAGLQFLKSLCVFDTRVTDLSPVWDCPMLTQLDAGRLPLHSPAAFAGLSRLRNLSLHETTLDTLAGIGELTQIQFLEVTGVIDGDLSPLLSLPNLKEVLLGEDMREAAASIQDRVHFTVSFR